MTAPVERGPLVPYEVIWRSGHIETIHAHQVLVPTFSLFGSDRDPSRLLMHGEIDGRWGLILDADYAEILSVRRLSSVVSS